MVVDNGALAIRFSQDHELMSIFFDEIRIPRADLL